MEFCCYFQPFVKFQKIEKYHTTLIVVLIVDENKMLEAAKILNDETRERNSICVSSEKDCF